MKAKLAGLFLVALAASTAQAEEVIYRKTQSARYVGQGQDFRIASKGFVVLDATNLTGYAITTYNLHGDKIFTVSPFEEGLRYYTVTGSRGKTHTVFVGSAITNKLSGFEDTTEFSIGANATLAITPTNTVSLPRVLTGISGGVAIPTGEAVAAAKGSGTASYSQTETRLANSLHETPADTLARYRASLLSRGYREETE